MDPGIGALDDPADRARDGAVRDPTAGNDRFDAVLPQQSAVLVVVVAPVGEQLPGTAGGAPDVGYGVEQGQQLGDVVRVAAGQGDGERGATGVGEGVVLRAGPGTVDRGSAQFWAAPTGL
ncbi:hypothetical protein GCM10020229_40030 [Kitasatospora albolonga]